MNEYAGSFQDTLAALYRLRPNARLEVFDVFFEVCFGKDAVGEVGFYRAMVKDISKLGKYAEENGISSIADLFSTTADDLSSHCYTALEPDIFLNTCRRYSIDLSAPKR